MLERCECSCPKREEQTMADKANNILSSLSQTDFGLLEPYLEPADLPVRKVLERRNKPIRKCVTGRVVDGAAERRGPARGRPASRRR